jgi:hypothetical protein
MSFYQTVSDKILQEEEHADILYHLLLKSPEKESEDSQMVMDEETGQLHRKEKRLLTKMFEFITRKKEPQDIWKGIIERTQKIEKSTVQAIWKQYIQENSSTESGNEQDLETTIVRPFINN